MYNKFYIIFNLNYKEFFCNCQIKFSFSFIFFKDSLFFSRGLNPGFKSTLKRFDLILK